jgi:hypothetical protein
MKNILKLITLIALYAVLLVVSGCEKQKTPFCGGAICLKAPSGGIFNCDVISFFEGALPRENFGVPRDSFGHPLQPHIIRGEVLKETYLSSRRIKVIEDLTGNLPENVNTLMVWGAGAMSFFGFMSHYITVPLSCSDCYKTGETLIMILYGIASGTTISDHLQELDPEYAWILTSVHSTLPGCTTSVLRLKNGYVTGGISFEWCKDDLIYKNEVHRMSWNDFQKELKKVLQKTI